jgi:hypothetical protein
MKSPTAYPNQFSQSGERRRPTLDGLVSEKNTMTPLISPRVLQRLPAHPAMVARKRGLDGAHGEKRAFLAELKDRSSRDVLWRFFRKGELYFRRMKRILLRFTPSLTPHKMFYGSLVGGIAFGMVSMAFMSHFLGEGVFARSQNVPPVEIVAVAAETEGSSEKTAPDQAQPYDSGSDIFFEYFNETADAGYQENVRNMVKGYPIEEMLPFIFEQDRVTAAFLIGIAKKESNWGKRVPVLEDQDCFNYWGYRGVRRMMGTGGHTCFNSRKDAVETVAKRIDTLVHSQQLNTPEKMIIWKCGFSCDGHSRESVKKWISDVDMYFKQLNYE